MFVTEHESSENINMAERKQLTLKDDLLTGGAKLNFYRDTTEQTQVRRAYEVIDLYEDTSSTLSNGVDMHVNLSVEGAKAPVRWSLTLADHLNDPRITSEECYALLRPTTKEVGRALNMRTG